jgi:hypothetical protein
MTRYELTSQRPGSHIAVVWMTGTLAQCKAEKEACKRELAEWYAKTWRIVRIAETRRIVWKGGAA